MNSKIIGGAVAVAAGLAVVGCSTRDPDAVVPKAKVDGPAMAAITGDPNPFANYEDGMAPDAKLPMAVEWHNQVADGLSKATSFEALQQYVMLPKSADGLLDQVKTDYKTDPMVATKIAGVSQIVMCQKWDKAPAAREIWTTALLKAAENAPDEYRKLFFIDQLRWCGKPAQADKVLAIAEKSGSQSVKDFAKMVASELRQSDANAK